MKNEGWTLRELVGEVEATLARDYEPTENGQVRAVPDERAIRYYTTLGLLDGPLALRGRTALYGARHLAQIVAIKRLQSSGKSLAEIQELMQGFDTATLTRVSGVQVPRAERSRARRADFWRTETAPNEKAEPSVKPSSKLAEARAVATWNVTLAPGVTLSFPAERALEANELAGLASAAEPLLAWLAAQQSMSKTRREEES